jgi:predicted permease
MNRDEPDRELDREIDAALDLLAAEHERAGRSPEEARRAARLELTGGAADDRDPIGVEAVKEAVRDTRRGTLLRGAFADARQALRGMRRTPGFTLLVVLTLGAGLGAATAVFGVVNAVLLRPLPYPHADRLALLTAQFGAESHAPVSGQQLLALRERSRLFDTIGGIWASNAALTGSGEPEQLRLGLVTANFLPLLVEPLPLGRHFTAADEGPGKPRLVILGAPLWRRRFAADPAIVGRTIQMDGRATEVVGVLPDGFRVALPETSRVPPDLDAFVPLPFPLADGAQAPAYLRLIGRLRDGATVRQAQEEAASIAAALRREVGEYRDEKLEIGVASLHDELVQPSRTPLLALSGGVGLVVLIACLNAASLLVARGAERRRELTLRCALGAAPHRLMRLVLTESVVLALAGGGLALLFGSFAVQALVALQPEGMRRTGAMRMDARVLLFALGAALLAGVLSGLAPALAATRGNLADALRRSGRGQKGGAHRLRGVLIACEVALGVAVLASAGLMTRTMLSLLRVDPGFEGRGALSFQVSLPASRYRSDRERVDFARRLRERLAAIPGVASAGMATNLPLDDALPNWYSPYWRDGASAEEKNGLMADLRSALPGLFTALGARLLEGRDFTPDDIEGVRLVAIVDDGLARRTWPGKSAVGQRVSLEVMREGEFRRETAEVIGVVRHVQFHSLTDEVRGQIYMPYSLAPRQQIAFVLRTPDPVALAPAVRAAVAELDPDLPAARLLPLLHYLEQARRAVRFVSLLALTLAAIALLLAVVGVYGVAAASVVRRTGEIGVRVALGAGRADVLRLVVGQGMRPVVAGCAGGLALSLLLAPLYARLLFGVRPLDAATHAAVIALLALAGFAACYFPARRALRLDPLESLRAE